MCGQVIPGREQCGIEALSWVGDRLFSAGLNGEITEYDLTNQKVKYTIDAYGGPIWTITGNKQGTHLAVGLVSIIQCTVCQPVKYVFLIFCVFIIVCF